MAPASGADIEIRQLTAEEGQDAKVIHSLTELINRVYHGVEDNLWNPGYKRTNIEEVKQMIDDQEMFVAIDTSRRDEDFEHTIIGSLKLFFPPDKPGLGDWGTLTVEPAYRKYGLGRRIVVFAEDVSRQRGCTTAQLELLVPKPPVVHPKKEFLKVWYGRMGYVHTQTETVAVAFPQLVDSFNGDMDIWIMQKPL